MKIQATPRQHRLILIICPLLVVGFFGTSLASYLVSLASLRREIVSSALPLTSDNIYSEIQRDLLRPVFVASMMASDTFLRDWVLDGEKDVSEITRYLKEIKEQHHAFTSFFVSDKTSNYYHFNGILKKVSPTEPRDAWYFRVRAMDQPYETNLDPDMANRDAMTVFINQKVFDYSGNFIGATGVGLTVDAVLKLIKEYQARYNREIYFVDRHGNVMMTGASETSPANILTERSGLRSVFDRVRRTGRGAFKYRENGQVVFLNSRYISEFGWYLMVAQVEDQAARTLWNTLLLNLLICGVITAGVLAVTASTIRVYQCELEHLATTDKLTALYNRQAFGVIFAQFVKDMDRAKTPLSGIMIDIDLFKNVNDTYGHVVGDRVLQKMAVAIGNSLRKGDPLCRWGGEEFLVLLRNCDLDAAARLARKIHENIGQHPFAPEIHNLRVTISLGVAQYRAGESEEEFVSRADRALYAAKHRGRDRVEIAQFEENVNPVANTEETP